MTTPPLPDPATEETPIEWLLECGCHTSQPEHTCDPHEADDQRRGQHELVEPPRPVFLGEPPCADADGHCTWCGEPIHADAREHHRATGGFYADELAPIAAERPAPPAVQVLTPAVIATAVADHLHGHLAIFAPGSPRFTAIPDEGHIALDLDYYGPTEDGARKCRARVVLHVEDIEAVS